MEETSVVGGWMESSSVELLLLIFWILLMYQNKAENIEAPSCYVHKVLLIVGWISSPLLLLDSLLKGKSCLPDKRFIFPLHNICVLSTSSRLPHDTQPASNGSRPSRPHFPIEWQNMNKKCIYSAKVNWIFFGDVLIVLIQDILFILLLFHEDHVDTAPVIISMLPIPPL